jgi:cell division septum initiation protein DivIVA
MTMYAEPTTQLPPAGGPPVAPQPTPRPAPEPAVEPAVEPAPHPAPFSVAIRGYDREQVDHHVRGLHGQMSELRDALRGEYLRAEAVATELCQAQQDARRLTETGEAVATQLSQAQEAYRYEQRRAEAAETEVALLRARLEAQAGEVAQLGGYPVGAGYGYRMEKLMRAAEREAEQERATAAEEAAALIEQAKVDAAHQLHDAERELRARATALDERERELAQGNHAEAARILEAANLRADAILTEARGRADHERWQAEGSISRRRAEAGGELDRLILMRDTVRNELARLLNSLIAEFENSVARIPAQERARTPHAAPVTPITPSITPLNPHRRSAAPDTSEISFLFQGNQSA